jgi:hypothetical protein
VGFHMPRLSLSYLIFVHSPNDLEFSHYCLAHIFSLLFTHPFPTMWNKKFRT